MPEVCTPAVKKTKQGSPVDASIADILSIINDCKGLETIASCSGLAKDHCGTPASAYLSFLSKKKGSGVGEFGMNFNPESIDPQDIKLYNAIRNSGWYPSLGTVYFINDIVARLKPIIGRWYLTGKGYKKDSLTEAEKFLVDTVEELNRTIDQTPDEIKEHRWWKLTNEIVSSFCPEKRTIAHNIMLYGDDYDKAVERAERWERTHGELTEEDQLPEEVLDLFYSLIE